MLALGVLICAASGAVGAAIVPLCGLGGLSGPRSWAWLGPAVGFAALRSVAALHARLPGHAATAFALIAAVTVAALVFLAWRGIGWRSLLTGAPVVLIAALGAALPFIVNDRV